MQLLDYFKSLELDTTSNYKDDLKLKRFLYLLNLHKQNSISYARIATKIFDDTKSVESLQELPYLPVALFKKLELKSVSDEKLIKKMYSSGTSGANRSRIYLDKETSRNQTKVLAKIIKNRIGFDRSPLLVIDSPAVIRDSSNFTARAAGIAGFSIFGTKIFYALNEDMSLNIEAILEFSEIAKMHESLIFGFTYIVWSEFLEKIKSHNLVVDFSRSTLIHGGGWKNLDELQVDNARFKWEIQKYTNIRQVINYYGMIEQTGSIFLECESGYLHTNEYNDVLVRGHLDFEVLNNGLLGLVQVFSVIPESYPGFSILTEDNGIIVGADNCACGRYGKYFRINGRIKMAEIRGCSDTFNS